MFRESGAIDDLVRLTGSLAAPVVIAGGKFLRGYDPVGLTGLLTEAGWLDKE